MSKQWQIGDHVHAVFVIGAQSNIVAARIIALYESYAWVKIATYSPLIATRWIVSEVPQTVREGAVIPGLDDELL